MKMTPPWRQYHPVNEQGETEDPVARMTDKQIDGFAKALVEQFRSRRVTPGVLTSQEIPNARNQR
jgi:hypothetical protein